MAVTASAGEGDPVPAPGGAGTLPGADGPVGEPASERAGGGAAAGGSGSPQGATDHAGPGPGTGEGSALALALPGDRGGEGSRYDGYYALLRRRVQEALTYPAVARRRELTGTVQVEIDIQPSGAITQVALAVSSSHRVLDEAALDAVRGIEQLPFPPDLQPRRLRVRLPVVFALR
jgi:protein TonB